MIDQDEIERRIRERAYQLWEAEGFPGGRADRHWQEAKEIIAIEDGFGATLRPADPSPPEEAALQNNLGEFPTLTDQGEEQTSPSRARSRS